MATRTDFSSGIPALDAVVGGIRPGDNIVLQADSVDDFVPFAHRYCAYAGASGHALVYFRFADHPPLLPADTPAEVHELDPGVGFERFISDILSVIDRKGKEGVYYLFDSLSGLAVDWYSDRMLGNFFRLTCPYLYIYDTVALFVLLRNVHTPLAVKAIRETAQVVLDVFGHEKRLYVLPLKVDGRSSPTMYMLHHWEGERVEPVLDSTILSEIRTQAPQPWIDVNIEWQDPWADTFVRAQRVLEEATSGAHDPAEAEALRRRLLKMVVSRDEEDDLYSLCEAYFDLADLVGVGRRMIGTGLIGGKSVGMLLARRILSANAPDLAVRLEMHDSFYVGSDVFYSYLVRNDCWWERYHLKSDEDPFPRAEAIRTTLETGTFPTGIIEQFSEVLDYFGQSPIIVRSSSLLEDAYGNAFSGKYDSVFLANQGDPAARLAGFLDAVRSVYASTMSTEAISYRRSKGLFQRDEQMALLVQRVSGAYHDRLYFPHIGGVGYSYNPFVWNKRIDPAFGMLRLVFGLGTRAVDRHDDDYTRVVALNAPMLRPEGSSAEVRKYSQRVVNVLDLDVNAHVSRDVAAVAAVTEKPALEMVGTRDLEMETRAREHGVQSVFSRVLDFKQLLTKTPFADEMHAMMDVIAEAYHHPVDIEFTVNFAGNGEYRINLLQCRPFHFAGDLTHIRFPKRIPAERIIVQTAGPLVGQSLATEVDRIVYIRPEVYGTLPAADRYTVARFVGEVMRRQDPDMVTMLIGPGRWGTRMPELGVPATLADIENATVLAEVSRMHEGLNPDLSLGTHFFNDLVEMNILYLGISPERSGAVFNPELLTRYPNRFAEIVESAPDVAAEAIHVADPASSELPESVFLWADALAQKGVVFVSDRCEVGPDR